MRGQNIAVERNVPDPETAAPLLSTIMALGAVQKKAPDAGSHLLLTTPVPLCLDGREDAGCPSSPLCQTGIAWGLAAHLPKLPS